MPTLPCYSPAVTPWESESFKVSRRTGIFLPSLSPFHRGGRLLYRLPPSPGIQTLSCCPRVSLNVPLGPGPRVPTGVAGHLPDQAFYPNPRKTLRFKS